jgi:hypothetical protein
MLALSAETRRSDAAGAVNEAFAGDEAIIP